MDRSAALALLKDVLAETVRAEGPDLNVRQAAILLRVSLEPGPHTVRGLAEALGLGKPAVSRALDALQGLGLANRIPHLLQTPMFASRFTAKGRYRERMQRVPVLLATETEPGLLGAAVAFQRAFG